MSENGGIRTRTEKYENQNLMPYLLAIPLKYRTSTETHFLSFSFIFANTQVGWHLSDLHIFLQ